MSELPDISHQPPAPAACQGAALSGAPHNPPHVAAVQATAMTGTPPDAALDRHAAMARRLLGADAAFIGLVDAERVDLKNAVAADPADVNALPRSLASSLHPAHAPCPFVVATGTAVLACDIRSDPRFVGHPALEIQDIASYAAVPLAHADGLLLGTLCVTAQARRDWTAGDMQTLQDLAASIVTELALRSQVRRLERSEAWMRSIQQELQLAMQVGQLATFQWDVTHNHVAWSDNLEGMLRMAPGTFVGSFTAFIDQVHADDRARVDAALRRALQPGAADYSCQFRMLRADGSVRWTDTRGRVQRDATGAPVRMVGVDVDITRHKERDAALRLNEERLRLAAEATGLGFYDFDVQRDRAAWSTALHALCGVQPDATITMDSLLAQVHADDRQGLARAMQEAFDPQGSGRIDEVFRIVRPDTGQTRWLHNLGRTFFDSDEGRRFPARNTGIVIDITQRRLAEGTLARERAVLDTVLGRAPIGFALFDTELRFLMINERLAAINGLPVQAHLGQKVSDLLPSLHAQARAVVDHIVATGQSVLGHEFMGATASSPDPQRVWSESWYPVLGGDGSLLGVAAIVEEVTEHKRLEADRLAHLTALREADRRKDEFLAMLSHELRNPLAPIRTAAEVLCRNATADTTFGRLAGVINRQSLQLARVVDDLLDVARIATGKVSMQCTPQDLRSIMEAGMEAVRDQADAKSQQITARLPPAGSLVLLADRTRLTQVVVNLLVNAVKFTPPAGHIDVAVQAAGGDRVDIQISDDGEGIALEHLPHVFDLFAQGDSTQSKTSGGLGIGLALVRRLVELHGGTVHAASAGPGQGACFTVRLPTAPAQVAEQAAEQAAGPQPDR